MTVKELLKIQHLFRGTENEPVNPIYVACDNGKYITDLTAETLGNRFGDRNIDPNKESISIYFEPKRTFVWVYLENEKENKSNEQIPDERTTKRKRTQVPSKD